MSVDIAMTATVAMVNTDAMMLIFLTLQKPPLGILSLRSMNHVCVYD